VQTQNIFISITSDQRVPSGYITERRRASHVLRRKQEADNLVLERIVSGTRAVAAAHLREAPAICSTNSMRYSQIVQIS